MSIQEENLLLKKRITELEKQLDNLRLSRRILMDLLEQIEKEKNVLTLKLQQKSKHLQKYRKLSQSKLISQDFQVLELKNYMRE